MNGKPKIIIISGCNGAGKSTLAPYLLRDTLGLKNFVNADTIAQGLSAYSPERVSMKAGRIMLNRLRELAAQKNSFAFETTLATRFCARWINNLKQKGFEMHLLFLWLESPELAFLRVRERVKSGGHDIPEDTIRRRYFKGIRNFFKLYQPIADSWSVFDNSKREGLIVIAEGEVGVSRIKVEEGWKKLCDQAE